jgi:hypothetical protein
VSVRRGLLVALVALAGCSLNMAQVREELLPRARADLSCNGSELQFEELKQTLAASNVRVTGCGREIEYVLVQSQWRIVSPLRAGEPPSVLEQKK